MPRLRTIAPRLKPAPLRLPQPTPADRQRRRALATNSTTWRKLRASILDGEPLCRICAAAGRITGASHVDHVDGDDSNNNPDNLQPLCAPCHSSKTAREDGGFGNVRKP